MGAGFVILISTAYVGVLFLIAWWGDKRAVHGTLLRPGTLSAACAYALTLAIYNTSWSFYGSVGRASSSGIDFLPIYIAPTLLLLLCQPLLLRVYTIAKAHSVNSIADFIATRYGKSQTIAAFVTIAATVSLLPYIALQLKAVGTSFDVLIKASENATGTITVWHDTPFAVAILMAAFVIIFGIRNINATEHHRGLMLAIAFESLVKIAAFLIVAAFIVFGMFDGVEDLLSRAAKEERFHKLLQADLSHPIWVSVTLIAFFAFLCLPQAFHVAIVENESAKHIRSARWLYPSYLIAFSVFMVPIAIAGLVTFGTSVNPDTFMITLPIKADATAISILAYIGGFSAATGMVIVSVVALSTMLCNDVVVPGLMKTGRSDLILGGDVGARLLFVRRILVIAVLLFAYLVHKLLDQSYPLTLIGLVSFVGIAQLGPAFLGGLYWRRANRTGAVWGMAAGLVVWAYTLLLPSFASDLPFVSDFIRNGAFGPEWFRTNAPFGTGDLDIISYSTLWSLSVNVVIFVLMSLLSGQSTLERIQADAFVSYRLEGRYTQGRVGPLIHMDDLRALVVRFLGTVSGARVFDEYIARRKSSKGPPLAETGFVDLDALRFTSQVLSGALGASSARVVMAASLETKSLSSSSAKEFLDEASEALRINHGLMRGMLESIPQGICSFDDKFRVTAWNNRFLILVNLPRDFVRIGLQISEIMKYNTSRGELGAEGLFAFVASIQAGASNLKWPYIYERRRGDGRILEVVFDRMPEGGYIATYTDVSERYAAAEALREANEQLEARVTERTRALELAKADAEQANATKTRFLAAASHDLLQPLHASRLFIGALASSLDKIYDGGSAFILRERQREHALNAAAALTATEQLLESLLDISSLDTGIVQTKIEDIPLHTLLAQLKLEYSVLAQERGLDLRVVESRLTTKSDFYLLRRILQNILSNAIKYTPRGKILVGCRKRGQFVRLEVWDTGIGIPNNELGSIFEEFRQLNREQTENRGIGLGLAIVERTCSLLGHQVEVRSELGRGSCFTIIVPRVMSRPQNTNVRRKTAEDHIATSSRLVLCIDDDTVVLHGTQALFSEWGHRCLIAQSLDEARSVLAGAVPDAILIDYYIGDGKNGLQILNDLRADWGKFVPAALITAKRSEFVLNEARRCNCIVFGKPLKPATLRRWLNVMTLEEVVSHAPPPEVSQ